MKPIHQRQRARSENYSSYFLKYNSMKKIIIHIQDNITEERAIQLVYQVVEQWRVSWCVVKWEETPHYCWASRFWQWPASKKKETVLTHRKSSKDTDTFTVLIS